MPILIGLGFKIRRVGRRKRMVLLRTDPERLRYTASCGYARRLNMERLNITDVDSLPKRAIFEKLSFAGAKIAETTRQDGVQHRRFGPPHGPRKERLGDGEVQHHDPHCIDAVPGRAPYTQSIVRRYTRCEMKIVAAHLLAETCIMPQCAC